MFSLGDLPMQRSSPIVAAKFLDHNLLKSSASDVARPLSEVYSGPHVAMDQFHAVPGRKTLKKFESYTKCPFAFTTNDLYAAIPAASSSQSRRNSSVKIYQANTVSLICLWTSLKSAYNTIVGPNKLIPTHQLVPWYLEGKVLGPPIPAV